MFFLRNLTHKKAASMEVEVGCEVVMEGEKIERELKGKNEKWKLSMHIFLWLNYKISPCFLLSFEVSPKGHHAKKSKNTGAPCEIAKSLVHHTKYLKP